METAKTYTHLFEHLKAKFSGGPKHNVKLLGLFFCRPDNKLAREEILPSLAYYHHRSGKNIDFFFAGFDKVLAHDVSDIVVSSGIQAKPEWFFDHDSFHGFRIEIESRTSWQYSGGSDFMLVNFYYDDKGEPHLDFGGAVILTLESLRQKGRLPDVGMLFEKIIRHCEEVDVKGGDESWGQGLDARPGSALMELCKSYLNEPEGADEPTDAGPNKPAVKKTDAEENTTQTPVPFKTGFRYDIARRMLIVTPPGLQYPVDVRYAEVLGQMFKREAGLYAIRASHLDYLQIACFFEMGRWKERFPSMTERQLKEKLREDLKRIENEQKTIAQDFDRQFSRWLRAKRIDADMVITLDKKIPGYRLGNGWHPKRMVINDSEAGLNYASPYIEKIDLGSNSGKTPSYMGMGDGKNDFDD